MISAYLTIDDCPSVDFAEKVAYLKARNIPALFFCIGQQLQADQQAVVKALQQGFEIGNHSWSHPYFSKINLSQCHAEILNTDRIISETYQIAQVPQRAKYFRFPYLDRGNTSPSNPDLALDLQGYLYQLAYQHPNIPGNQGQIDIGCTFDQEEYHQQRSAESILARADQLSSPGPHLVLVHDHTDTSTLFYQIIDRYVAMGVHFLPLPAPMLA